MNDSIETSEREAQPFSGEQLPDLGENHPDYTGREILAAKLIDTWAAHRKSPVPWRVAVEITAIITFLDDDEKARLLALGVAHE